MRAIALRKVVRIRCARSDCIHVIRASLVEIDETHSQAFGDLNGSITFVGKVLDHGTAAESPAGQRGSEDRGREGGGDFFGKGAQVSGVVCYGDSGGSFLVVVAELECVSWLMGLANSNIRSLYLCFSLLLQD